MNLTPKQRALLELLAAGREMKQAAGDLGIALGTAKGHFGAVLLKLGARNRAQAVAIAIRQGVIA